MLILIIGIVKYLIVVPNFVIYKVVLLIFIYVYLYSDIIFREPHIQGQLGSSFIYFIETLTKNVIGVCDNMKTPLYYWCVI